MTDQISQTTDTPTFDGLGLHPLILKALAKSGYTTPTPIQQGAIPHAMNGRDLLLSAQTGSGKTASFVLPILDKLAKTPKSKPADGDNFSQKSHRRHAKTPIKALILTPTRELAIQVQDSVRKYSSAMRGIFSVPLVGGAPYGGQIRALHKGVQIVIATPGRLIDHMNDGRVDLSELDVLVLDEADRMLDMGFSDAIDTILAQVPTTRQTVMSSATWDGAVGKIAESFTTNPERISIKVQSAHIDESVYFCDDFYHKNQILLELLKTDDMGQAIIFTATKRSTEQLAKTLTEHGLSARYLHGDLPQGKRNRIIKDVKSGECGFLIATDVVARGIDIATISHVVNYDLPRQVEDYVHRIGRSGRAGRTGVAMNLCSRDDQRQLGLINRYLNREMKTCVVAGLEPKFTPKKTPEKNNRKDRVGKGKFERKNGTERHHGRFGKRPPSDKSDDFYQKSHQRAFEMPIKRGGLSKRGDEFFDAPKRPRRDVRQLEREYRAKYQAYDETNWADGRRFGMDKGKPKTDRKGTRFGDKPHTRHHRPKKTAMEEVVFYKRPKKFGNL
ncbi:MAG: DEAD/DEAH box helicase [Moraxella sp.]|nr:DEAD/DEAH box helicase [Moraxella sp.]